jgi:Cdc6-like AAA superfamily ATPase
MNDLTDLSPERRKDLEPLSLRQRLTGRRVLSYEDVMNVFTPTDAIRIPARFAGRVEAVEKVTSALLRPGTDIIVSGERGTGKTSLAYMLQAVAKGEYQLLDYYGLRQHLESKGRIPLTKARTTFTVVWISGFGQSFDEVIYTALTRRADGKAGPSVLYYLEDEASQIEVGTKIGFDKVFTGESSVKEVYIQPQPHNIKQGFELATQRFASAHRDKEILIIIDEFETVQNRAEVSQYLKSANARFALIGIGSTSLELLGEHASVPRTTFGVSLPPMSEAELSEILLIGRYILRELCQYSDQAVSRIARLANGSPYWCQFLAEGVLDAKIDSAGGWQSFQESDLPAEVNEEDVYRLVAALPTRADTDLFETALSQAIMGDETNKRVLRTLAAQPKSLISTAELETPFNSQGIDPKVGRATVEGFLTLPGLFEISAQIRDIIQFSFVDPNFRRYILLRCPN